MSRQGVHYTFKRRNVKIRPKPKPEKSVKIESLGYIEVLPKKDLNNCPGCKGSGERRLASGVSNCSLCGGTGKKGMTWQSEEELDLEEQINQLLGL